MDSFTSSLFTIPQTFLVSPVPALPDKTPTSRYTDSMGAQVLVDHMRRFEQSYGAAFTPCQLLLDHAKSGKKFYS